MEKKIINNALSELLSEYEIDKQVGIESKFLAQYMLSMVNAISGLRGKFIEREEKSKPTCEKQYEKDFIERMYQLYPSKCPIQKRSLGKSSKDKDRIRQLLKRYSKEEIEFVIRNEVNQKYNKSWMSNFSTFLNNFPDPTQIDCKECAICAKDNEDSNKVIISGVEYR